ncbi:hypothetical protein GEU84_002620 [Fertoebacter nigrum]|uniref:Colicin transporter n=1 Tax=Fertoeibacter niger TaxID=2656921 RepID=A0A8X8KJJ2_9RHOB|nr:hypothetical protein [Fertoeibacter niger]NUB43264.1 hypothetical protein [Fertoeibacter niger]
MQDIAELEGRITAALDRIGKGVEALSEAPAEAGPLAAALDEERTANAQLAERLRAVKERDGARIAGLEAEVARLTGQLDVQGLEMQRLRQSTIQLREHLRALREAQESGLAEPGQLNKAMQAELEALRAARSSELAEMDAILAELTPLLSAATSPQEERADA